MMPDLIKFKYFVCTIFYILRLISFLVLTIQIISIEDFAGGWMSFWPEAWIQDYYSLFEYSKNLTFIALPLEPIYQMYRRRMYCFR